MSKDYSEEEFAARINGRIAVITGITFPKCKLYDQVCVHLAYWDSERAEMHKCSAVYKKIYTNRKWLFQKLCEDFELIQSDRVYLKNLIGCYCVINYHPVFGILLHGIKEGTEAVHPDFEEAAEQLANEEYEDSEIEIPYTLQHYWICPKLDAETFYSTVYHGMIIDMKQEKYRNGDEKIIIYIAVFADGKPCVFRHFINDVNDPEIDDLMDLFGAEKYLDELIFQKVDCKLHQSSSGKIDARHILKPRFHSNDEAYQVARLIKNYRKFLHGTKDSPGREYIDI